MTGRAGWTLPALRKTRAHVEIGLLVALCLFLPLHEFWKNATWLAYVLCWLVNRMRAGNFGGAWDLWDTLLVVWIGSGFAVAALAGIPGGGEWHAALDIVRYASIFWLVKRARYAEREIRWLLAALVCSAVTGLAIGHFLLWADLNDGKPLELLSVGHVNHTAIYVAIVLGLCVAWLLARWPAWRTAKRALGLAAAGFLLMSLLVTASRGTIAAGMAMIPLLAALWWPRWRTPFAASLASVVLVVVAAYALQFEVVQKHEHYVASHNAFSLRDGIWRMGLEGWKRYPFFGVGMDNYGLISLQRVEDWKRSEGQEFDGRRYVHHSHAHNLAINTLAERGIFGAAILAAVLLAWIWALVRRRPRPRDSDMQWILFGAAAGAWWITVVAGAVNTTLHHEHAILAVLLLGLWLSKARSIHAPSPSRH